MSNMKDALVQLVTAKKRAETLAAMAGHPLHVNLPMSSVARVERQAFRIRNLQLAITSVERRIREEASTRSSQSWHDKLRTLRLELVRRLAVAGILETD